MGFFVVGGITDIGNFHHKTQGLAGEWMVGVHVYGFQAHFQDGEHARAFIGGNGDHFAGFQFACVFQVFAGNALEQLVVVFAVGVFRGDGDIHFVTGVLAFQGCFQTLDDVVVAVQVGHGLAGFPGAFNFTAVIGVEQAVLQGDHLAVFDSHARHSRG